MISSESHSASKLIHTLLSSLVITCCMGLAVIIVAGFISLQIIFRFTHSFLTASQLSLPTAASEFEKSLSTPLNLHNGRYTVLILGTDYLATRGSAPILTDTIMLTSVNPETGSITLLSLPRDIWFPEKGMKINALYQNAKAQGWVQPELSTQEKVEELSGEPIAHTFLITLEQVAELIDTIGGVPIVVEEGFTDPLFPRSDVDVTTERDPQKLYKTITFEKGYQVMSGERALEFIRSRHSSGTQGNDISRNNRQQQVFTALIQSLQNPRLWIDPVKAGKLYAFYDKNWSATLPLSELLSLGRMFVKSRPDLSFTLKTLSEYPYDPAGHLIHPQLWQTGGQWAFIIRDKAALQIFIQSILP